MEKTQADGCSGVPGPTAAPGLRRLGSQPLGLERLSTLSAGKQSGQPAQLRVQDQTSVGGRAYWLFEQWETGHRKDRRTEPRTVKGAHTGPQTPSITGLSGKNKSRQSYQMQDCLDLPHLKYPDQFQLHISRSNQNPVGPPGLHSRILMSAEPAHEKR